MKRGRKKGKYRNRIGLSSSPTLSLCMIVKDEEANLPTCMNSVKGVVDEIIVVDTGSSDRTPEIAKSFGAKVFFHPWEGDFSKHRNRSLSYALGDWFLIMDADEELDHQSKKRLKAVIKDSVCPVISVIVRSYLKGQYHNEQSSPRLFRKGLGIHYEGVVHNQLVYGGHCLFSPEIVLWHHGYNLSEEKLKAKFQRTRILLEEQINKNPDYPPAYHNLAVNYYNCKEWEKAIEAGKRAIAIMERKKIHQSGFSWTFYIIVNSLLKLQWIDEAEFWAIKGLQYDDRNPDCYWLVAVVSFAKEEFQKVVASSQRYLALCDAWKKKRTQVNNVDSYISNTLDRVWEMHRILGYSYMALQQPKEASDAFWKSASLSPQSQRCSEEYGIFLFEKRQFPLAMRFLERVPISSESSFRALRAKGQIYETMDPDRALDFYNHLERTFPQEAEIPFRKGDLLIRKGLFQEAAWAFARCIEIDPDLVEARINLGFACERTGEKKEAEAYYRKAIQINPNCEIAKLNLVVLYTDDGRFNEARKMVEELFSKPLPQSFCERLSKSLFFHLLLARIDLGCGLMEGFRGACHQIFKSLNDNVSDNVSPFLPSPDKFHRLADLCKRKGDLRSYRMALEIGDSLPLSSGISAVQH